MTHSIPFGFQPIFYLARIKVEEAEIPCRPSETVSAREPSPGTWEKTPPLEHGVSGTANEMLASAVVSTSGLSAVVRSESHPVD